MEWMNNQDSPAARRKLEAPYAWQSRVMLARIKKSLGGMEAALGRSVYLALCEISSERRNTPVITERLSVIAERACLRYRKTQQLLQRLADTAHAIYILSGRKKGEASTYVLLPARRALSAGEYAQQVFTTCAQHAEGAGTGEQPLDADSLKRKPPYGGLKGQASGQDRRRPLNQNDHPGLEPVDEFLAEIERSYDSTQRKLQNMPALAHGF